MGLSDIDEDVPVDSPPPSKAAAPPKVPIKSAAPSPAVNQSGAHSRVDLESLFGDFGAASPPSPATDARPAPSPGDGLSRPPAAASTHAPPPSSSTTGNDVLDSLFADQPAEKKAAPAEPAAPQMIYVDRTTEDDGEDDGNNLFDFSKPAVREQHHNAESFLEAFERQGKKSGAAGYGRYSADESLEKLTRNKDDNKVRARLLALMNYYDVLGVAQTASKEEIQRSYRKKALELHPDKVGRNQTAAEAELFKTITKAHEVLMDSAQRAKYDEELRVKEGPALSSNDWLSHLSA